MLNETHTTVAKKYHPIIEAIYDNNYRRWNNSGEYNRRYKIEFIDGSYYTSNSMSDIRSYLAAHGPDMLEELEVAK